MFSVKTPSLLLNGYIAELKRITAPSTSAIEPRLLSAFSFRVDPIS